MRKSLPAAALAAALLAPAAAHAAPRVTAVRFSPEAPVRAGAAVSAVVRVAHPHRAAAVTLTLDGRTIAGPARPRARTELAGHVPAGTSAGRHRVAACLRRKHRKKRVCVPAVRRLVVAGDAVVPAPTPTPTPIRLGYRVLSIAATEDTTGDQPATAEQYCGYRAGLPVHGETSLRAQSTAGAVLDLGTGRPAGSVSITAPVTSTIRLRGCEGAGAGAGAERLCQLTRQGPPGRTTALGFSVTADGPDAAKATIDWSVEDPSTGFVDPDDSVCNVPEMWHGLDPADTRQVVDFAPFRGTAPFQLEYTAARSWTTGQTGTPMALSATWSYTVTLQRVTTG